MKRERQIREVDGKAMGNAGVDADDGQRNE